MKNASDIQNLKIEIIHWLTSISDKEILSKILAIKSNDKSHKLSPEQESELDSRLKKYLRGEMKFKSWDDAKNSIRKRAGHAA